MQPHNFMYAFIVGCIIGFFFWLYVNIPFQVSTIIGIISGIITAYIHRAFIGSS